MNLSERRRAFRAWTVAPARDLAESVVASLNRARLRYIEGLVILKPGFKAAAVIKRGCRLGRGGLGGAVSPLNFGQNVKPLLVFPLGQAVLFTGLAPRFPGCISRLFGPHELDHVARLEHLGEAIEQFGVGFDVFGAPHRRAAQLGVHFVP
jgi:hypothetical protein